MNENKVRHMQSCRDWMRPFACGQRRRMELLS